MKVEISDALYKQIENHCKRELDGVGANELIKDVLKEAVEITPTKEEKREWKQFLYNSLLFLATERPELYPRKKDSLNTLLESFLYWAEEYNDGYFTERDEVDSDRYCAWLVQEYDRYATKPYIEN